MSFYAYIFIAVVVFGVTFIVTYIACIVWAIYYTVTTM